MLCVFMILTKTHNRNLLSGLQNIEQSTTAPEGRSSRWRDEQTPSRYPDHRQPTPHPSPDEPDTEALKKRNVFCMLEPYGGPKHVDITIKDAKLYVGLDGEHHSLDPDQLLTDLTIDAESFKEGFATKRYTLHEIDHNLDEIADALAEVVKKRIKHIQQEDFVKSKSTKTSETTAKHKHSEHKEPNLQVIK